MYACAALDIECWMQGAGQGLDGRTDDSLKQMLTFHHSRGHIFSSDPTSSKNCQARLRCPSCGSGRDGRMAYGYHHVLVGLLSRTPAIGGSRLPSRDHGQA